MAGGAIFDVSGLSTALTLGSNQTLSNSASATGKLAGNLNPGAGTNSVSFGSGTPAFMAAEIPPLRMDIPLKCLWSVPNRVMHIFTPVLTI